MTNMLRTYCDILKPIMPLVCDYFMIRKPNIHFSTRSC